MRFIETRMKKLAADTIERPVDSFDKYRAQVARHEECKIILEEARKIFTGSEEGG